MQAKDYLKIIKFKKMKTKYLPQKFQALVLLTAIIFTISCKDNSMQENKATVKSNKNILEQSSPKASEQLNSKTPLNKQELEDTFPIRIGDNERDFLNVSEDMATSEGAFGNGKIHFRISDAAGPLGSSVITLFNATYDLNENFPPTTLVEKKLRNGIKTRNRYETDTQDASIEFIYINRFHMLLTGKNITPDELWTLFEFDNYISSLQVLDDFDNKNIDRNH